MTKSQLKRRILDVCNGAGYRWLEEDGYFDQEEGLKSLGLAIRGLEISFDLDGTFGRGGSRLRLPWQLERFEQLNTLVELIQECLEYDVESNDAG